MAKNKNVNTEEQGDELDVDSLDSLVDEEADEYEFDILDEDDEEYSEEDDRYEEKETFMNNLGSSMNLTGKSKMVISGLLIGAVVVILLFNPFGKKDTTEEASAEGTETETKQTFFQKLFGEKEPEEVAEGVAPEGEELIETIMRELETDNPGYEIVVNEDGTITLTGILEDLPHIMTYSNEGELLSELHNGVELIEGATTPAFTTDPNQTNSDGTAVTPPVIGADIPEYTIPEDTVLMKKDEYDKSVNSLSAQAITEEYDENGLPYYEMLEDRFIVQYEKLPIKGKVPMLYSRVIETGEVIIFPVTLEQYMGIEDKGTTVIGVEITKMHGVTSYDNIFLVEWKK